MKVWWFDNDDELTKKVLCPVIYIWESLINESHVIGDITGMLLTGLY
jgi:hypothetical protein